MKKLLPVILAVLGLGVGVGAGAFLQPAPEEDLTMHDCEIGSDDCPVEEEQKTKKVMKPAPDPDEVWEYVKLPKQFVVPVIRKDRVRALVVVSLSLEVTPGVSDSILAKKPKLRDAFLQVMFDHANSGGFDGAFTSGESMKDLRGSLYEVAYGLVGEPLNDVLIEEIVKQNM